jgi:hypothetical protein
MANKKGFTIEKWNGEYGEKAVFVVTDNVTHKQALFTPGREKDVAWSKDDLVEKQSDWKDFGSEQIANLEDVVF